MNTYPHKVTTYYLDGTIFVARFLSREGAVSLVAATKPLLNHRFEDGTMIAVDYVDEEVPCQVCGGQRCTTCFPLLD